MDMIEEYEERKRLRRSRFRWRLIAGLAVLAVIAMVIAQQKPKTGAHIARYSVEGVILDDRDRDKALKKIAEDDTVEALILSIDSPRHAECCRFRRLYGGHCGRPYCRQRQYDYRICRCDCPNAQCT